MGRHGELRLNKKDFLRFDKKIFENWYDSNLKILKTIKDQLLDDLQGYYKQTGADSMAFFSVRIKDKESFIKKVENFRKKNETEQEEFFNVLDDTFQPQDVIKDLIGARLVFYFENDIYICLLIISIIIPNLKSKRLNFIRQFLKTHHWLTRRRKTNLIGCEVYVRKYLLQKLRKQLMSQCIL